MASSRHVRARARTHTHTRAYTPGSNQTRVPLSFVSLARSPELSKNITLACSDHRLLSITLAHTQPGAGRIQSRSWTPTRAKMRYLISGRQVWTCCTSFYITIGQYAEQDNFEQYSMINRLLVQHRENVRQSPGVWNDSFKLLLLFDQQSKTIKGSSHNDTEAANPHV